MIYLIVAAKVVVSPSLFLFKIYQVCITFLYVGLYSKGRDPKQSPLLKFIVNSTNL